MNLTSILGKFISPKIALTALHKNLESEVKHEIKNFTLVFIKAKNEMYFEVLQPDNTKKRYSYPDGKNLIKIIESISKDSLQKTDSLDVVILLYADNEFKIEAYYRNEHDEKIKKTFDI